MYKEEHGDCNVPQSYESNKKLGRWVGTQRTYHKNGELCQERTDLLEEIGFRWVLKSRRGLPERWMASYVSKIIFVYQKPTNCSLNFNCCQQEELKVYKEEHGDCNVPRSYESNKQLGRWVNTQRKFYKNEELCQERTDLLEEIGFKWVLASRGGLSAEWMARYVSKIISVYQKPTSSSLNSTAVDRRSSRCTKKSMVIAMCLSYTKATRNLVHGLLGSVNPTRIRSSAKNALTF